MSSFFRDSNLFATRNNKPLFQAATSNSKISFDKLGSKHKNTSVVVKPFNEGLKLECNSIGESEGKMGLKMRCSSKEPPTDRDDENGDSDNERSNEESMTNPDSKGDNNSMDEDDDVEITDVRDLGLDSVGGSDIAAELSHTLNNDIDQDQEAGETMHLVKKENNEKMDNVSMEYLLGTISHLNEKNRLLQKEIKAAKHENEEITSSLKEKTESIGLLKHKVFKFKCSMDNSNAFLKDLKIKFVDSSKQKDMLSDELKKTKESIHKEHEFLYSLKNLVANLKAQNSLNEGKISQKDQRIENLDQKANDLAGRLSEEKIKNSQLNKELVEVSKKYESDLFKCTAENKQLVQSILDQRAEFKSTWVDFVDNLNTSLSSINCTTTDSIKNLKLSLDDNFNDLALRLTGLGAANETIQSSISASKEHTTFVKEELVSALSSIDKNIVTHSDNNFNVILQKLNGKCTSQDLECFSNKMVETIDRNIKSEKEISMLQVENKKLLDSTSRVEKQVSMLNVRLETKVDEIKRLNEKISKLSSENTDLINNHLSVISDLQNEKDKLIKDIARGNEAHTKAIEEYRLKLESSKELAKQVEEKNINLFNQEKKKVDSLSQRLAAFDKTCEKINEESRNVKIELIDTKDFNKMILNQLKEMKEAYDAECKKVKEIEAKYNETTENLDTSNADIEMLKNMCKEKEKCIADLRESLKKKEKILTDRSVEFDKLKQMAEETIKEKKEEEAKTKDEKELPHKANPRKLFSDSRTSTVVKQETAKPSVIAAVRVKVEKTRETRPKKVVGKRKSEKVEPSLGKDLIKPKAKKTTITKVAKPKRKLISSSQSSIRSSQSAKEKKQQELTRNILQDLDIFNEFEAIDKLGTIVKPGW